VVCRESKPGYFYKYDKGAAMIEILSSNATNLDQLKQSNKFVVYCRRVAADSSLIYYISREENEPASFCLMGLAAFQSAMAAVNPADSLTPFINNLYLPLVAASVRMDEMYHVVVGASEFPGSDSNATTIGAWGLEKEIREDGTIYYDCAETQIASGGAVITNYPIADITSVAARKAGGSLTVNPILTPNLGVVLLNDGASPVADGTAVSITYSATRYAVMNLQEPLGVVDSVLVPLALLTYLSNNT
jgi:hypothetical protein